MTNKLQHNSSFYNSLKDLQSNGNSELFHLISRYQKHPFHLVERSPWPILTSFSLFMAAIGAVTYMHAFNKGGLLLSLGLTLVLFSMILWFIDVNSESSHVGHHTKEVKKHHMIAIELFIISEAFAFLSIFWAYFHSALAPSIELGGNWPPLGIDPMQPWAIPLLNTLLLVGSGSYITLGHHSFIGRERKFAIYGFIVTLILASIFTGFQYFEYSQSSFNISDSVYSAAFFCSTGLHGFHVIVGTLMLFVAYLKLLNYQTTNSHHAGAEAGIVYWHFVDVVWLLLFAVAYVWPYGSVTH